MPLETTIPVLACASVPETLHFYGLLGFEATHCQRAPYVYVALRRGDTHLHFHGGEGVEGGRLFGVCLWIVPELEGLYQAFAAAMRGAYGKLPLRGQPRITRFRPGQGRFTVVDPAGNSVIVVRREGPGGGGERGREGPGGGGERGREPPSEAPSRLARALKQAAHLRDVKGDDEAAAAALDAALARDAPAPPFDRARALLARAELAVALGEAEQAKTLRAAFDALPLGADERQRLRDDLRALDALERSQR